MKTFKDEGPYLVLDTSIVHLQYARYALSIYFEWHFETEGCAVHWQQANTKKCKRHTSCSQESRSSFPLYI
jgi:hypothetical protein